MRRNTPVKQRGMLCPCGRSEILALGLCSSCYSMKRQDEENYGGLREVVLDRDQRRCRACPNIERRKLCVHHRVPGISRLDLMITLCTACHAIVERTQIVLGEMTRCYSFCGVKNIPKPKSSFTCLWIRNCPARQRNCQFWFISKRPVSAS